MFWGRPAGVALADWLSLMSPPNPIALPKSSEPTEAQWNGWVETEQWDAILAVVARRADAYDIQLGSGSLHPCTCLFTMPWDPCAKCIPKIVKRKLLE